MALYPSAISCNSVDGVNRLFATAYWPLDQIWLPYCRWPSCIQNILVYLFNWWLARRISTRFRVCATDSSAAVGCISASAARRKRLRCIDLYVACICSGSLHVKLWFSSRQDKISSRHLFCIRMTENEAEWSHNYNCPAPSGFLGRTVVAHAWLWHHSRYLR